MPTAILSDTLGRLGTMASAITPMTPTARLIGIARTVRCFPGDFLTLLTALAETREGEVLVVEGGGGLEVALLGNLMALEARRKGVRGFVIDGAVRDLVGLEAAGIPVFEDPTRAVRAIAGAARLRRLQAEAEAVPAVAPANSLRCRALRWDPF